jgi:hypothetical protein
MDQLVKIKYWQPAKRDGFEESQLEAPFDHPPRYCIVQCLMEYRDNVPWCCQLGGQGWFPFLDGFCPEFLGHYPAVILQVFQPTIVRDEQKNSRTMYLEYSKFQPFQKTT